MKANEILALLGQTTDAPKIEKLFFKLQTRRRSELDPEDRDVFTDWVLVRRQGVELGFVDQVYFQAGEKWKRRRKGVPLLLHQVYFYTKRDDILDFTGQLPFGLQWSDNRATVRRKLKDFNSKARFYVKDVWEMPEFQMIIDYKDKNSTIDSIVCQLELNPWPEKGRVQPELRVEDWISFFGLPPNSQILHERLRPLNLKKEIEEGNDERELDFFFECGVEIYFTESKDLKLAKRQVLTKGNDLVFGGVRFFRSRELDARQWTGELPFELSFDDTQKTILDKVGRAPDEQGDDDFSGFALWHFPDFILHIVYSNMSNYLLQVLLKAPGF